MRFSAIFKKSSDTSWHSYDFQAFNVKRRSHLILDYIHNRKIYWKFIKILDPQILNWKLQFAFRMKINTLSRKSWRKLVAGFFYSLCICNIFFNKMIKWWPFHPWNCLLTLGYHIYFSSNPTFLLLVENNKFLECSFKFLIYFRTVVESFCSSLNEIKSDRRTGKNTGSKTFWRNILVHENKNAPSNGFQPMMVW